MPMHFPRVPTLLTACSLLAACVPVHADDVVGRYRLNQGHATDVVEVRANGTYIHRYTAPPRPAVVDSGRWTLEQVNDRPAVVFDGFVHHSRSEFFPWAPIEPSIFPAPVERTGSTLKLTVDDDINLAYVKQDGTDTSR